MENIEDGIQIEKVCNFFKEIIKVLSKPRRIAILNVLANNTGCTFKEIQTKTGIPQGSLHEHLMELLWTGFICRTNDQPMEYESAKLLDDLIFIAKTINM